MRSVPNSACEKLKAALILILIFWQTICPQKIAGQEAAPALQNCWSFPAAPTADIGVASDNAKELYISLTAGKLIAIDAETGKKRWETELGGDVVALPLIDGDTIFTAARYSGADGRSDKILQNQNKDESTILRALDKTTGVTDWQIRLAPVEKLYLFNFENYIVSVGDNGQMDSIGKIDGKIAWRKQLKINLSAPPLVKDAEIFLGTADNRILKLSLADGRITQQSKTFAPPTVIIENSGKNRLIVGDRKGNLLLMSKRFDRETKPFEWRLRIGAEISSVTHTFEGLLISSFDNFIYLISEDGGKPLWKKRFNGRIIAAPLVGEDYFIVSAADESVAVIAELRGGRSVNRISLDDDNFFIGSSLRRGNLLIYTTLKGVFGYTLGGGCVINRKPEEQKDARRDFAPF